MWYVEFVFIKMYQSACIFRTWAPNNWPCFSGDVSSIGQHPILLYILHASKRQSLSLLASLPSLGNERFYSFCSIRGNQHSITISDFFTCGVASYVYNINKCLLCIVQIISVMNPSIFHLASSHMVSHYNGLYAYVCVYTRTIYGYMFIYLQLFLRCIFTLFWIHVFKLSRSMIFKM